MDTCPECGNGDLSVVLVDGVAIVECGLCGERFGQRRALESLADREEADREGFAAEVWPLVRSLWRLPGLAVRRADPGEVGTVSGPAVALELSSSRGLDQIQNVAQVLRLAGGSLRLPWTIEVEAEQRLLFVVRPRRSSVVDAPTLRAAHIDLVELAREIERNRKLSWWRG